MEEKVVRIAERSSADAHSEIVAKIAELSCGNLDAAAFLESFFEWVHFLDDVVDGEADRDPKSVCEINLTFLLTVTQNPFYLANSGRLMPLIIQGAMAWIDSHLWHTDLDANKRVTSDVLKGYYHEVFYHVAFICGGWDHATSMTAKHRAYDYE